MSHTPELLYSEKPALELMQQLGYQVLLGEQQDERTDITEVVLKARLLDALERINPWLNEYNLHKAFERLTTVQGASLMEINQKVWELLRSGTTVKQVIGGVEEFRPVYYIDYEHPANNDFLVVSQLKYHGKMQHSIPDLMVYLNGLPVGVIECKSPTAQAAWDAAYNDLTYYQQNSEKLFHYNQICAGIWGVGGRYGAITSPQAFYSVFKTRKEEEVPGIESEQDKLLYHLFQPKRLLDLIRHFVIFELDEGRTIKKLPRYQQLRATNRTIEKLLQGQGGVVWHTQGSGKSITMAYLTRKLMAPELGFNNPTVLVMTDRKDLDRQITTTFRNIGLKNVHQASSVAHLDKLLRNDYGGIITTTLQKFQETDKETQETPDQTEAEESGHQLIEKSIKDGVLTKVTKVLEGSSWKEIGREEIVLEQLSSKENLYVLVDEAHRSHYGFLASFMRTVLPHAKFIAFTGTPISKEDKSTLGEFYGGDYIDVYTIQEAVEDGATKELFYDEGIAKLSVKKRELDAQFATEFGHLPEEKQHKLKQAALGKYQLSAERVEAIAKHMLDHFRDKIYPDGHKAMVVCDGRPAAIRYKQAFEKLRQRGYHNFDSKVLVSLGSPKSDFIAREYYEALEWNRQHPEDPKPLWVVPSEEIKAAAEDYKLPYGDEQQRDSSGQNKVYDNTAFLIVSDMLLTGYDAPIASCLYLDKPLKEHNLLQAIARVNRARKGKEAGFIVDYIGIAEYLKQALEIFSGDVRPDDILKNLAEELPRLELNHTKLVAFFKPLKLDRAYNRTEYIDAAVRYIESHDKRDEFKELLKQFNKSLNIVLPNTRAMKFQPDFKLFNEIKLQARNAYPDDEELKVSKDESLMLQAMIDAHLKAEGVENLLQEPVSIIDKKRFEEELKNASPATRELKMRNNLKHTIKVGLDKNPDFYRPLAEELEELLKQREQGRITQLELLLAYTGLQDRIIQKQQESHQKGFVTERQRAVYDSMQTIFDEDAEDATRTLFDLIQGELNIVGWEEKGMVQKDIENKIMRFLKVKMERAQAKDKARELVEVLRINKDA